MTFPTQPTTSQCGVHTLLGWAIPRPCGVAGVTDLSHHGDMGIPNTGTFHATGEASPVGKYHQREVFPVEVPNSLGCFKSRVWEPDLSSLLDYLEKTVSS